MDSTIGNQPTIFLEEMHERKLPRFNSTHQDEFQLWTLRVKSTLNSWQLAEAFDSKDVENIKSEIGPHVISLGLRDSSLH